MVDLNKRESRRFIKKMLETERRPITQEEKEMAEGVREIAIMEKEKEIFGGAFEESNYVIKDGFVTFRGTPTFSIDRLMKILKKGKRMKKGQIMCNIWIDIPITKVKGGKKNNGQKKQ